MNVKEFYASGKKVFDMSKINALVPNFLTQNDENVLNTFFPERFESCELQDENESVNQNYVAYEILMKKEFYKSIIDAVNKQFDTLVPTLITEMETNSGTDTHNTTNTVTLSSTETPNITSTDSEVAFDGTAFKDTNKNIQSGTTSTSQSTATTNNNTDKFGHTIIREREGKDNIDYRKAIEDMYETKRINFYDILLNNVAGLICILVYFID